jgi:hypothetical protein
MRSTPAPGFPAAAIGFAPPKFIVSVFSIGLCAMGKQDCHRDVRSLSCARFQRDLRDDFKFQKDSRWSFNVTGSTAADTLTILGLFLVLGIEYCIHNRDIVVFVTLCTGTAKSLLRRRITGEEFGFSEFVPTSFKFESSQHRHFN